MFPGGIVELLKQVITSWEVIAATLGFIFFVFIVNNAARRYRRPQVIKKLSFQIKKPKPKAGGSKKKAASSNDNSELGLEES